MYHDIDTIANYDYLLPIEKIAKFPLSNRDDAKLLHFDGKRTSQTFFQQLPEILPRNALLVFNNTKVIKARLNFLKKTGAKIEILCLQPHTPSNFEKALLQNETVEWICMVGNLKKWKEEVINSTIIVKDSKLNVYAKIKERLQDSLIIKFWWDNKLVTFAEIVDVMGQMPIPPYLERESCESDKERYQTIYSKYDGSVAAPTAGLHFTENLLKKLSKKGIKMVEITLHVGAGTFKPIKSPKISEHIMHSERFELSIETLKHIIEHSGPIIAVGTTSVRTLESLYILGIKLAQKENFLKIEQWDGLKYKSNKPYKELFSNIIDYFQDLSIETINAETSLMIVPGFKPKVISGLITNFHQPHSTLLLLLAALVGNEWKTNYQYALDNDFRFLSYGDSSFWEF
ncbi:MAG: S-adenosylmethionine:tRNA ribosyltransferase-isomerase [Marinilabiliaceae bacterium]|nr:S-adenosylmethionine:tRNA ribosyltransferase-isomerase [Marinilabiliaceae bacterium]